jgi:hypothetical protein
MSSRTFATPSITRLGAASEQARSGNPTQVAFPLYDKQRDYDKWTKGRASWYSEETVKVVEWAQPYQAEPGLLHPLRILRVLSNTDKHRLLNVVDYAHIALGIGLDPMPPKHDYWTAEGPVTEGDLLARLEFPRPPFKFEMNVQPSFGWYESVAYEAPGEDARWLRLDEMMNAVCEFTVKVVGLMSGARHGTKSEGSAPESEGDQRS